MTIGARSVDSDAPRAGLLAAAAAIAGIVSLTARGVSWRAIAITIVVGAAGLAAPVARRSRSSVRRWWGVVALGTAAVAVARLSTVALPIHASVVAGAASLVAGVAEELFFRRFLYGVLARWGSVVAIAGTAVVFAAVHIPAYGVAVIPIDLTAGLVLGWQRWASGSWTAPAVTHVAANLLSML